MSNTLQHWLDLQPSEWPFLDELDRGELYELIDGLAGNPYGPLWVLETFLDQNRERFAIEPEEEPARKDARWVS